MTDFNKKDYIYIYIMLVLTIVICIIIHLITNKFKQINRIERDIYEITVEDHLCKCNIKYYSDTINVDKLVYFKSNDIEYEIDSSLVKNICIKY